MGEWNRPVVLPRQKSAWETTILPTMTNLLANLALVKMQHNYAMDIAEMKIKAQQATAKVEQQQKTGQIKAKGEQRRKTVTQKAISEGKLVRVPDAELHVLPPAMQQQLVRHEGAAYAPYRKETKTSHQAKTKYTLRGNHVWAQDYDYNPKTKRRERVGKPYMTRRISDDLLQTLLSGSASPLAAAGWEGPGTYTAPDGQSTVRVNTKEEYNKVFGAR